MLRKITAAEVETSGVLKPSPVMIHLSRECLGNNSNNNNNKKKNNNNNVIINV